MERINLISDTVTRPTEGMLQAMMQARVGDDVFKADPTVNELEERVAALFGKESALFFPSGTMANQTAIKVHTQPGEQLIADVYAHIFNYEGGGVSFNSGVSCKLIQGNRGMITAEQVEEAVNPPDFYHSPLTSLVCLENTTNKGGGACWDFQEILRIKKVCERHSLAYHLDGARLWNALVAKGETALQYGNVFDSISVCFSKGLGCPVGSMLVGNQEFIKKAIRVRKIFGGGMRQAGYLAAAALYALDHHINRLSEDHQRAMDIAKVLEKQVWVQRVEPVETNILIFQLKPFIPEEDFMCYMKEKGVDFITMGQGKLRLVTHLDYTGEMHERFLSVLSQVTTDWEASIY